jgi:hypothetical protein
MSIKVTLNLNEILQAKAQVVINDTVDTLVEALKAATPVDTGHARDGWQNVNGKIINDVEYISELNSGSSKQAPAYFIERTLLEHSQVDSNGVIVTPTN